MRNKIERRIFLVNRFATSRFGRWLGRTLAKAADAEAGMDWAVTDGPWFGNQLATIEFSSRSATFTLAEPVETASGIVNLVLVATRVLS